MPFDVDDVSIRKIISLKHYKDLFVAAAVTEERGKMALAKDLRTKFNATKPPITEEKEWVQLVTDRVTITKKPAQDNLDWLLNFRQQQPNLGLQRFSQIVKTLGAAGPNLVQTFGVNTNIETLKQVRTAFGPGLAAWLSTLPDNATPERVLGWAAKLAEATMPPKDVQSFWTRFDGVDRPIVWQLIESAATLVFKAYQHAGALPNLADFWMKKMDAEKQKDRISRLMQVVYDQSFWSAKPVEVNALAESLCERTSIPWLKLFHVGQLLDIEASMQNKAPFLPEKFFDTAGTIAAQNHDPTKDVLLGEWLSDRCYYVAYLVNSGITVQTIREMYEQKLTPREMITCTWFQQQPTEFGPGEELLFKVENVHGGIIARRSHLATRHLYQFFNFGEIKAKNSFHPRGTTIMQMVTVAGTMKLLTRNEGVHTLGPYCVCVGVHQNVEKRLVIALYPNVATTHQDYYTDVQLQRILKLRPLVSTCQPLNFPP